jgi:hypothetical protein
VSRRIVLATSAAVGAVALTMPPGARFAHTGAPSHRILGLSQTTAAGYPTDFETLAVRKEGARSQTPTSIGSSRSTRSTS